MKHAICSAGAVAALALPLLTGTLQANLLVNPGFEITSGEGVGWEFLGGAWSYKTSSGAYPIGNYELTGINSLLLPENGTMPLIAARQTLSAQPGQVWTLSGLVMQSYHAETSYGTYGLASIEFIGGTGSTTTTDHLATYKTENWQSFSISAEAPAGTTDVIFTAQLIRINDNPVASPLFFDNMSATISSVPEVPPGLYAFGISVAAIVGVTIRNRKTSRAKR
jgi:hypothetical protein